MTEAISSLYAEIGFKVNESGLTEFVSKLNEVKDAIKSISSDLNSLNALKFPKININSGMTKEEMAKEEALKKRRKQALDEERRREDINKKFLAGLSSAFAMAFYQLKKAIFQPLQSAADARIATDFSVLTGDTMGQLQHWYALAASTGVKMSRSEMAASLKKVADQYWDLVRGGNTEAVQAYHFLGVNAAQSPDEMMKSLWKRYRELQTDDQKRLFLNTAGKIGLPSEALYRMFGADWKQLRRADLLKSMALDESDLSSINRMSNDFVALSEGVRTLRDEFSAGFSQETPKAIREMLETLADNELRMHIRAFGEAVGKIVNFFTSLPFLNTILNMVEAPGKAFAQMEHGDFWQASKTFLSAFTMNPWLLNKDTGLPSSQFSDYRTMNLYVNSTQEGINLVNGLKPSYDNTITNLYLTGVRY